MGHHRLDNGEAFMRANRALHDYAQQQLRTQQQAINPYNNWWPGMSIAARNPYLTPRASTPGERPEPEDTTGLKMLEEFLLQRRRARDGDERQ